MKFNVNEIPQAGLELTEDFDARAWDIETQEIKFKGQVHARAFVTKSSDSVFVSASVGGTMIQECVRCLASSEVPLSMKLDFVYAVGGSKEIVLDDDLRQEILLGYPVKTLCREDCKGLCVVCGQNLNEKECGCDRTLKDWREK